jgi:hypothetical protein
MSNVVQRILKSSDRVDDGRTPYYVLSKCMEELGELSTEVAVASGHGYKTAGKDGVVGEIMDTIASLTDLAYLHLREDNPELTLKEINEIMYKKMIPKLYKWESNVQSHKDKGH